MSTSRPLLFAAPLALALLSGCTGDMIDPVVDDIEDRRMVVEPMRDSHHFFFESPRGIHLAKLVTDHLVTIHKTMGEGPEVVSFDDLVHALRNDDPKDLKHADVGRKTKADVVLVGNITRFETSLRGDVGFRRGAASVELQLIETAKPERPLYKTTVSEIFRPDDIRNAPGMDDMSEEEIETALLAALTKKIAQLFYAHPPER